MTEGRWDEDLGGSTGPNRPLLAVAETLLVGAAYIAISTTAVAMLDVSSVFPASWIPEERGVGNGFLVGAVVQITLVLLAAYVVGLRDLREAIGKTIARSTTKAWTIAAVATAIHIGTAVLVFIPEPERVWEASSVNLILSSISAADGWSQEMLFRGYVLFRLARARIPALAQILISGALFSAIHTGYAGDGTWATIAPLAGTFMLGGFYAWAVQSGRGSLLPVVVGHMVIIAVVQPWLALAH